MIVDTRTAIGSIEPDPEALRTTMLSIAACGVENRDTHRLWAMRLRLLTPTIEDEAWSFFASPKPHRQHFILDDGKGDGVEEDEHLCVSSDFACRKFRLDDHFVRLTEPGELPECHHYTAVSYCWGSSEQAEYHGGPFTVRCKDGARSSRCPPDLLRRAIQLTTTPFIWIDQECIDQADALDKETGIQAMDLVYQRAADSVAILEACIQTQEQVDALNMLCGDSALEPRHLPGLVEALEIILADPWFTRAWTLQESTSGSRQMALLVKYLDGLEVPSTIRRTEFGDIELGLSLLHETFAGWLSHELYFYKGDMTEQAARCSRSLDKWFRLMVPETDTEFDPDARAACSGIEALAVLSPRLNSVVSDRLAIMANLSMYETRLDHTRPARLGSSFSVCALVLSVLNGDISLLQWDRADADPSTTDQQRPVGHGYSWMPACHQAVELTRSARDNHETVLRIKVVSLSPLGLGIEGCLWVVDHVLDLSHVQQRMCKRYGRPLLARVLDIPPSDDPVIDEMDPLYAPRITMLIEVLCQLVTDGYRPLSDQLWSFLRLRPTSKQIREHPELQSYATAKLDTVVDIDARSIRWTYPRSPANQWRPLQTLHSGLAWWLFHCAVADGCVAIARPCVRDRSAQHYTGLFVSAKSGDHIFTPQNRLLADALDDGPQHFKLATPRYGHSWYPMNCKIRRQDSKATGGKSVFACDGFVPGNWKAEEDCLETVYLV